MCRDVAGLVLEACVDLARFASRLPSVNAFDAHVNTTWGLSTPATVGMLDQRLISIQLQGQDDLSLAWSRASRVFNGQQFLLLRWSPNYRSRDSRLAAVWLRLPGLPLPLHNPSFLMAIGDFLGSFLRSDVNTTKFKHPRALRICVEMDMSAPLPPAFFVACGASHVLQRISVESRCLFCSSCFLQGHSPTNCRNRKRKRPSVVPQAASSGMVFGGGSLLAGTPSPEPINPSPSLSCSPSSPCPPSVCGIATENPPLSVQLFFDLYTGPISPPSAQEQAHFPSSPLVGPAPAPLAPPTNPPPSVSPLACPL
ncbi:DUF4283 domain-containing protein [Cephalotus follicularis]|uniref:DUF4283 domain-containing protein n=1 Tax=Cephalotus follicularis TaxID=3775 RepID=A0A1Q3CC50_CEPFO|nr:DUF4283 domain-containing protein [Cephalotus follicularis]